MKNLKQAAVFFILLSLADEAIVMMFPIHYLFKTMSFVPHFAFMFLLIFTARLDWLNKLLCAMAAGLITDLFFGQTFPFLMFFYPVLVLAQIFIQRWLKDRRVLFLSIMVLTITLDFIPYAVSFLFFEQVPTFNEWFYCLELMTILGNGMVLFIIIEFWEVMEEVQLRKRIRKRRKSIHI